LNTSGLIPAVIADTGGLLRALARTPEGKASFPDYREILISASAVIVPASFLRKWITSCEPTGE
jgi:hypothetical protein